MIGQTISHYTILEKLGEGGMGVVYKAEDTRLRRAVALKFLPPELTSDPEAKGRFIHEAQAASALDHPNICNIHEIAETSDGRLFIVMAYYEGETLKQKIARGALNVDEAMGITIQICQGLSLAHEAGIVHRDIKPANILITHKGEVKIVDFGLAKLSGHTRMTRTGSTLGTVAYMSPEQARGDTIDSRVDIWSLGVVLYEMVTGDLPFKSDYEQAVVYSILNEPPRDPLQINPLIGDVLNTIILRMLAKDPASRYQTADEVMRDLKSVREGGEAGRIARAHSGKMALFKARRSKPIVFISIAVVAAVAVFLLVIFPTRAIPFSERDWVIIADFENTTGESVFDKALNTAFNTSIEQSSYVNVVPRRRIEQILRLMKKSDTTSVRESVTREIALREGINVFIVPGISKVGSSYALTWKIEDAKDGMSLKSGIVEARTQEEILSALDEITQTIRHTLGESQLYIRRQGKPLSKVTTSSLEALMQYSLGIENHRRAKIGEAKVYYEAALGIDSTFTAAKASLGMLCYEQGDPNRGKRLLAEAVTRVDELTEKERYGILAFYARAVENNIDKALNEWKALLALYPDYSAAHHNSGWLYSQKGQLPEALEEYKKAVASDPTFCFTYYGILWIYLYDMGEVDSAITWAKKDLLYCGEKATIYDNLGYAYIGKDSLEQALTCYQKVTRLDPKYVVGFMRLSDANRMLGRYKEAIPPLESVMQLEPVHSWAAYQLGIVYDLLGDKKSSRRYYELFHGNVKEWLRKDPNDGKTNLAMGLALARLGEKEKAWTMGQKALKLDSSLHFEYAQLLCALGRSREAVDQLELAVQGGFRNYIWMKMHPEFSDLKDNVRFKEILRRGLKGAPAK